MIVGGGSFEHCQLEVLHSLKGEPKLKVQGLGFRVSGIRGLGLQGFWGFGLEGFKAFGLGLGCSLPLGEELF